MESFDGVHQQNAVVYNRQENSFAFNGHSSFVRLVRPIQGDFSIEFEFKTTDTRGASGAWYHGRGLVDAEVAGKTNDFGVTIGGGRVMFGVRALTIVSGFVADNNWHTVLATRQQSTGAFRLEIDGILTNSGTGTTASLNVPPYIDIGRLQTGISYFSGSMRNVRIFDEYRTPLTILNPPENSRWYSSVYANSARGTGFAQSMINSPEAWSAGTPYPTPQSYAGKEWMYINAGAEHVIHGVVTQGRHNGQLVTSYKVHVYRNGWVPVLNEAGSSTFTGNTDKHTQVWQRFRNPETARYVKFTPLSWIAHISMRAGLLI